MRLPICTQCSLLFKYLQAGLAGISAAVGLSIFLSVEAVVVSCIQIIFLSHGAVVLV